MQTGEILNLRPSDLRMGREGMALYARLLAEGNRPFPRPTAPSEFEAFQRARDQIVQAGVAVFSCDPGTGLYQMVLPGASLAEEARRWLEELRQTLPEVLEVYPNLGPPAYLVWRRRHAAEDPLEFREALVEELVGAITETHPPSHIVPWISDRLRLAFVQRDRAATGSRGALSAGSAVPDRPGLPSAADSSRESALQPSPPERSRGRVLRVKAL
jgi:hypothetical protein